MLIKQHGLLTVLLQNIHSTYTILDRESNIYRGCISEEIHIQENKDTTVKNKDDVRNLSKIYIHLKLLLGIVVSCYFVVFGDIL